MRKFTIVPFLAACVFVVSCSSTGKLSKTLTTLSQNNWQLYSLGTSKVSKPEGGQIPSLAFDAQNMKVSGNSGCNTFSGGFKAEKEKLSFGDLASTRMACPDMNIETNFLSSIAKTANFSIYDGKLVLKDTAGTQLMSFDPVKK